MRSWSVIPVRPRSKTSLLRWEEYQHRYATEVEVAEWSRTRPQANIGIVTGRVSGLAVLDIDPRHGGEESLHALEQSPGGLPPTVEARTGGGGRHLYFALPPATLPNRIGLAPRHRRPRQWRHGRPISIEPPVRRDLPVPSRAQPRRDTGRKTAIPATEPRAPSPGGTRPSERLLARSAQCRRGGRCPEQHHRLACGHLLWRGMDPDVATELLLCWNRARCRPRLDDTEVVQVMSSIVRLHSGRHLGAE